MSYSVSRSGPDSVSHPGSHSTSSSSSASYPASRSWFDGRLGEHAAQLRALIPRALREAHIRARGAHDAAGPPSQRIYGNVWELAHQELADRVAALDGGTSARVRGIQLGSVGDAVLYPWRYSDNAAVDVRHVPLHRPVSHLRAHLFGGYGDAPTWEERPLIDAPVGGDEERAHQAAEAAQRVFAELDAERIVLVAFASNVQAGLLRVQVGEVALLDDGYFEWHRHEELPCAPADHHAPDLTAVGSPPSRDARFDTQREPQLDFDGQLRGDPPAGDTSATGSDPDHGPGPR